MEYRSKLTGWNAYALSKATLNMLISLYAGEVEKTHFSAVAPGGMETEMQNYISKLEASDDYPVLKRLQAAKGTANMPIPKDAAPKLAQAFEQVLSLPSGKYVDIRNL